MPSTEGGRANAADGLRGVVAALADGLVVVDRSRRVRFANPAACRLLGRPLMSLLVAEPQLPVVAPGSAEVEVSVAGLPRTLELHASRGRWDGEEALVVSLHDVTARARARAELEDAARRGLYDPLTGLPARALLVDRIEQALARSARTSGLLVVMFVDLDDFKPVNDRFGHDAGDRVLKTIAERMAAAVRPADTVCRLGGDEFVIVGEGLTGTREARQLADRVRAVVKLPTQVNSHEVVVTASIGLALADSATTVQDLLHDADAAMLSAKNDGKASVRIFDDISRGVRSERVRLEGRLRSAVEAGRLDVAYQPIISLDTGAVVGCEALLRYLDPDRGVLTADAFIGAAETAGVVVPLGTWVLAQACRDAATWHEAGWELPVSVNVGAAHVASASLARSVNTALERTGVAPEALCLDLAESAVVSVAGAALGAVTALANEGVRVGLDHWGARLAPVMALVHLPLSYVKVHRSIVAQVETDQRTARALVAAARAAGLNAIAVGIESTQQARLARELGCKDGQGYHLGKPMPSKALLTNLAGRAGNPPAHPPRPSPRSDGRPEPER